MWMPLSKYKQRWSNDLGVIKLTIFIGTGGGGISRIWDVLRTRDAAKMGTVQ